jgi:AraC-like DNA-binding protein
MDHIAVLVTTSALAAILAATVAVLSYRLVRRRDRRQIDALLARLSELEDQVLAVGYLVEGDAATEDPGAHPSGPHLAAPLDSPPADVLAGRTSYVRRVVEGRGAEVETLAGQAIAAVHRRLTDTLLPADLAGDLHISLRTLERGLAADLSCTPTQLIVAMKMREARRLLLSGSYRVNEVASRLGFSSPYHFSRRFKEFYQVAPSELTKGRNAA